MFVHMFTHRYSPMAFSTLCYCHGWPYASLCSTEFEAVLSPMYVYSYKSALQRAPLQIRSNPHSHHEIAILPTMTSPSKTTHPNTARKPTGLLDLPAELRNRIWKYALTYSTSHVINTFESAQWFDPSTLYDLNIDAWIYYAPTTNDAIKPSLLQVCKQINREATPIFYSSTFIDTLFVGGMLLPNEFQSFTLKLDLLDRPRRYNFKSVFLCLYFEGGPADLIRRREPRDAAIIGHYADVLSRRCGTLDEFHVEMFDWSERHFLGPEDDVAIPLMRGFGMLHAEKVTFGAADLGVQYELGVAMGEEERTMPLRYLFDGLCEIAGYCGFGEVELKGVAEQNLVKDAGSEVVLADLAQSWVHILEKAIAVLRGSKGVEIEDSELEASSKPERRQDVSEAETRDKVRKLKTALEEVVMNRAAQKMSELNAPERNELEKKIRRFKHAKFGEDLVSGWESLMKEDNAFIERHVGQQSLQMYVERSLTVYTGMPWNGCMNV